MVTKSFYSKLKVVIVGHHGEVLAGQIFYADCHPIFLSLDKITKNKIKPYLVQKVNK